MIPAWVMAAGIAVDALSGESGTSSSSQLSREQLPFLQNLWAGGQQLAGYQGNRIGQQAGQMAGDLGRQGNQFLSSLSSNPFLGALQQQAGGNPQLVNQQAGQLGGLLDQQAGRLMHQVGQGAAGAGQFGASRGQIGKGLVGEEALRAFSSGVTDLQSQDAMRSLQAATAGGGLQAQGAGMGLSSLQGMFDLGMSPFAAQWMPMQQQRGLLGSNMMDQQSSGGGSGLLGGLF